jgi:hypothetical protein
MSNKKPGSKVRVFLLMPVMDHHMMSSVMHPADLFVMHLCACCPETKCH